MELTFLSRELRSICEDEQLALRHYEMNVVERLTRRLADLSAARTIDELVVGSPQVGTRDGQPSLTIQLIDQWRLQCRPGHVPPYGGAGPVDWSHVHRLQVVAIEKAEDRD